MTHSHLLYGLSLCLTRLMFMHGELSLIQVCLCKPRSTDRHQHTCCHTCCHTTAQSHQQVCHTTNCLDVPAWDASCNSTAESFGIRWCCGVRLIIMSGRHINVSSVTHACFSVAFVKLYPLELSPSALAGSRHPDAAGDSTASKHCSCVLPQHRLP